MELHFLWSWKDKSKQRSPFFPCTKSIKTYESINLSLWNNLYFSDYTSVQQVLFNHSLLLHFISEQVKQSVAQRDREKKIIELIWFISN